VSFRTGTCRFLLSIGLLAGVAGAQSGPVWIDVPFVRQEKNGCGAAAVAMLMRYWARDADAHVIQQELYSGEAHGMRGADIERYLRENGFRTFVFQGEWQDLEEHVARGRPLLVALHAGRGGPLHYVVVSGVDTAQNLVLINDPAQAKLLKAERGAFEKDWSAAGRWTLLAIPQSSR
jgi:ABC-type bacteriocin/lantibiotic exporter with double-glycine peptidase domain